ncbi:SNF2 family N-terminal domain-containing protein [Radiomyces spectabilis]|uniref:SNF2 family N-terminal domain-containing protein n=1 Tax=Radiomyces spectabilis TaxID=64574 RepID=UPI00221EA296|nr:SNF2 family N-terminal domain-containing protein [Radiomyces spectabilis]KAI8393900.1 SNF2 family N-terminal domain-containing protein [Radiomyces spectabilis]
MIDLDPSRDSDADHLQRADASAPDPNTTVNHRCPSSTLPTTRDDSPSSLHRTATVTSTTSTSVKTEFAEDTLSNTTESTQHAGNPPTSIVHPSSTVEKKPKVTKRAAKIAEKLKNKAGRSLFDTDGDVSSHNILEPSASPAGSTRNSRKRKVELADPEKTDPPPAKQSKPANTTATSRKVSPTKISVKIEPHTDRPTTPRKKATERKPAATHSTTASDKTKKRKARGEDEAMPLKRAHHPPVSKDVQRRSSPAARSRKEASQTPRPVKCSTQRLLRTPKTPLDKLRNDWLIERETQLQTILDRHDAAVRELYHLEVYQDMLSYDPQKAAMEKDERLINYMQNYDLWDLVNEEVIKKQRDSGARVNTRHSLHHRRASLVDMLQNELDRMTPSSAADTSKEAGPSFVSTSFVRTGTGIKRYNRQFPTLGDYLGSFISLEDNEDITPEEAQQLVAKERAVRQRLAALNERGGFSTQLQAIANRRPQMDRVKPNTHHNVLLTQVVSSAKLFHSNSKYRRNAARKCAKAVDRYWDAIRTHDERLQKEEMKRMARLAKWTAQQVKKKWKIVERICEARHKEILKEEQAEKGRRHLELILEHSEQMLGVRMEELSSRKPMNTDLPSEHGSQEQRQSSLPLEEPLDKEPVLLTDQETAEASSAPHDDDRDLGIERILDDDEITEHSVDTAENDVRHGKSKENVPITSQQDEEAMEDIQQDTNTSVDTQESLNDQQDGSLSDHPEWEEEQENDHIIQQEGESDDDDELADLTADQDLSVEELLRKYHYRLSSDEEASEEEDEHEHDEMSEKQDHGRGAHTIEDDEESRGERAHSVNEEMEDNEEQQDDDELMEEIVSVDDNEEANRSGSRLDTPIPVLLRGQLREYQHVGLDWLASLYTNGLNGILADEMGLGKTIQTIALLAHLACERGLWGPHLIVVPTSVILNWEMEFKRWLPGFKILTYYGNPRERKEKRLGWSKENAFHVCITSYQLVLQDQNVFRRKAWQYLILDEAHHIKNFRSQRWQVLLNFNSSRRLLLTGTPLQNNLMELWSLLYFLMPSGVSETMPIGFANLRDFQEWFSQPVDRMIESQQGMDEESRAAIQKLHTVLRPYLLRRLKADVEKQMPEKHEHIVYCRLSKRQRYLYDDFMSRAKTKETLASDNFLSIINCLMQLRKVCNHPDLFEERPILTSFAMTDEVQENGQYIESLVRHRLFGIQSKAQFHVDLGFLNLVVTTHESMDTRTSDLYDRLDATKQFLKEIVRHQKLVDAAEARGFTRCDYHDLKKYAKYQQLRKHAYTAERWRTLSYINSYRCAQRPVYGIDTVTMCRSMTAGYYVKFFATASDPRCYLDRSEAIRQAVTSYRDRIDTNLEILERYGFVTPKALIYRPTIPIPLDLPVETQKQMRLMLDNDIFHPIYSRLSVAFPDKRLLQYDCGKLQKLATLLRELAAGGHRVLIFTQMTRVLDVLEAFLNMHGHRYLRLDGATKVEKRQILTEQFNNDKRILVFILSTRSGGLGINLTGADTVIFYDSDWNPSMDKQCQDRAHRIGQTRDVHIYRFVTEYTIEENIFKKANQKRMLDNVVIQEGAFTTDYFNKMDWWRDLPEVRSSEQALHLERDHRDANMSSSMDMERALLEAEGDENDAAAALAARKELNMDEHEFEESTASTPQRQSSVVPSTTSRSASESPDPGEASSQIVVPRSSSMTEEIKRVREISVSRQATPVGEHEEEEEDQEEEDTEEMQLGVGHVDQYMLRFWEREVFGVYLGFGGLPEPETNKRPSIMVHDH